MTPVFGEILPILLLRVSVNHRLPSEPVVMANRYTPWGEPNVGADAVVCDVVDDVVIITVANTSR